MRIRLPFAGSRSPSSSSSSSASFSPPSPGPPRFLFNPPFPPLPPYGHQLTFFLPSAAFLLLLLVAAYAGLSSLQLGHYANDKALHLVTFFLLTIVFYWILDTNRRRLLNMTLLVCTLLLGVGSEFLQSFLPNNRDFDLYDIIANVVGSLAGLGLCSWYHKRMLERRRKRKNYNAVPGDDSADLELGDDHETGLTDGTTARGRTLEEEVDNWDEHAADDWDEDDQAEAITAPTTVKGDQLEETDAAEAKKRTD